MNLNLFSLMLLGRENKFKSIFTPLYSEEKINLNLFFPYHYKKGRKIYPEFFGTRVGCHVSAVEWV